MLRPIFLSKNPLFAKNSMCARIRYIYIQTHNYTYRIQDIFKQKAGETKEYRNKFTGTAVIKF